MTGRKTITTTHSRFTVAASTSEKVIGLMQMPYEKIVSVHDAETGEEIPQKSPSTILKAIGTPRDYRGGPLEEVVIEFTERGYTILSGDPHKIRPTYFHTCDESAPEITDACRDQIVKYLFKHSMDLPGIGRPVQWQYFAGLTSADVERIGNDGKKGFYN